MTKYLFDTNSILRFLLRDNEEQYSKTKELFEKIENNNSIGYISALIIAESIWVLGSFYKLKKTEYIDNLINLASLKNLHCVELPKSELMVLLNDYKKKNIAFIDLYVVALSKRGYKVFTFDKDLIKNL